MSESNKTLMNVALHTVSIGLLSCIGAFLLQSDDLADIDLSAIEQYGEDWGMATYTKIDIDHNADQGDVCKDGYVPLFHQKWPGTYDSCDCTNDWRVDYYYRKYYVNDHCNADYQYYCTNVRGYPSQEMTIIEDSIVCAKAAGTSFMAAVRPDPKTLKCPTNYKPCSQYTSPDNTLCIKESEDAADVCPITKIEFREFNSKDDAKAWAAADKYTWKYEDYSDDIYMFWTKEYDALPIQSTSLESSQPCMNPTQSSIYEKFSPPAIEKTIPKCKQDITNKLTYDPRYNDTGIDTTYYNLRQESGIDLLMQARYPQNVFDVNRVRDSSKATNLNLFTRSTLSWKLSCESN